MFNKYLFVILLLHSVLSSGADECVRYYFDDYDELFTRDVPSCSNSLPWNIGSYEVVRIIAPNPKSKWYIKASPSGPTEFACTASFLFTMVPGALVEANFYFETFGDDILKLHLMQRTSGGNERRVGLAVAPQGGGYYAVRMTNLNAFIGNPPFQAYIVFEGRASEDSVMAVDSFRYVPLSMDPENECILYEDMTTTPIDILTTTPTLIPTTTPTTTSTTIKTTTTTDPVTTPDTEPTTTPIPPKNISNYFVEEILDFQKSIRIFKKRTKIVNFDGVGQPLFGIE